MKFKIKKASLEMALSLLKKDDYFAEIELEPVIDTATQAIYENDLRNRAYQQGIEYGYKEGFYEGRCPEKRNRYCRCYNHCCN